MMMSESKTPITDEVEALAALWDDETGEGPDGSAFAGDVVQYLPQWSRLKQCESDLAAAHETARSFRDMHYAALAERDALAARVAEAEASRWQPIETCPESCRGEYPKYVLFYNGYHIGVGFCYPSEDGDGGTLYLDEIDQIVTPRPTHWMPPPLPPGNDAALSREEKS